MKLIEHTKPKIIIADEGKKIKSKDDFYVKENVDEFGNLVLEHVPYYTTLIFVPDDFTEDKMHELYEEE